MKLPECQECGAELIPELMSCPHCEAPADHEIPTDLRCECGFLLCKLAEDTIEIKCRRCKRLVCLPVETLPERFVENKKKMREWEERPKPKPVPGEGVRGQYCSCCGQYKQGVVYGKCLDCRTESIKIQYKSRSR